MLIKNVKISDRSAKAIKLVFRRGGSTRNVYLAFSQIKMGDTHDGVTDFIDVADWLWHVAVEPLRGQGYIPPFDLPKTPANEGKICTVLDGTYTVVFDNDLNNYRTLRVRTSRTRKDFRIVSYLYGCDNTNDFKGFASPEGNELRFWKKFNASPETQMNLIAAWKVLVNDPQKAGEAYAMRSGNCYRCNRPLTVPLSLHRGLGPDCYEIVNGGGL
jgi:hypothetical protein